MVMSDGDPRIKLCPLLAFASRTPVPKCWGKTCQLWWFCQGPEGPDYEGDPLPELTPTFADDPVPTGGPIVLWAHVAATIRDPNTISAYQGSRVMWIKTCPEMGVSRLVQRIVREYRRIGAEQVNICAVGRGAAVVDALKEFEDINVCGWIPEDGPKVRTERVAPFAVVRYKRNEDGDLELDEPYPRSGHKCGEEKCDCCEEDTRVLKEHTCGRK